MATRTTATQQQPRFTIPRFYRQYNEQNGGPTLPPKPVQSVFPTSNPHCRSKSATYTKPVDATAHSPEPSLQQRNNGPLHSRIATLDLKTGPEISRDHSRPRPALSLILPNEAQSTIATSDSHSAHSRSSSSSLSRGQGQPILPPNLSPRPPLSATSEILHAGNPTLPTITATTTSVADPSPSTSRPRPIDFHNRSRSYSYTAGTNTTAQFPTPMVARNTPFHTVSTVTKHSPLNSHPRSLSESHSRSQTVDATTPPQPLNAYKSTSEPQRRLPTDTTIQRTRPPYQKSREPLPVAAPVRSNSPLRPSRRSYTQPTTTTKQAPPHKSTNEPAPSPTNLGSNGNMNTNAPLLSPSTSKASFSSSSTTSMQTQYQIHTPPTPPTSAPSSASSSAPTDAAALLALTHHVRTQTAQARHLFTQFSTCLPPIEMQWIETTIADTEAATRDILLLTEPMRVDRETNNGKVGLKTQLRWLVRDSRKARERRERLVLCHASLVPVLVRLQGFQARVPVVSEDRSHPNTTATANGHGNANRNPNPNPNPNTNPAPRSNSPVWDLSVQLQDPGMELVVDSDASTVKTSTRTPSVQDRDRDSIVSAPTPTPTLTSKPAEIDDELLDLLSWRWTQGRVTQ